jgi:hydrogenase maturation protease
MPSKLVLCLGNELLADDALGAVVAARLQQLAPPGTDVVYSEESGLRLLDHVQGVSLLVVVDSLASGQYPPGTIRMIPESEVSAPAGGSPHYFGLFEVIGLARALGLQVPDRIVLVAVEASDCSTIGGGLTPAVRESIPGVVETVIGLLSTAQ